MSEEIAKYNAKYVMETMHKTINYSKLDRGIGNGNDVWLGRYAITSYAIAKALEKEKNAVSIIGKYDEIMHVDWIIELYKRTKCKDLKEHLNALPYLRKNFTSENMPKVELEFQFVVMIGSRYQNYANSFIKKEIDPKNPNEEYEFIFENLNDPEFDLIYLKEKIKINIYDYFAIKDFIIENNIRSPINLKDVKTIMQMVKI